MKVKASIQAWCLFFFIIIDVHYISTIVLVAQNRYKKLTFNIRYPVNGYPVRNLLYKLLARSINFGE